MTGRRRALEAEGLAVKGSRFTYAIGKKLNCWVGEGGGRRSPHGDVLGSGGRPPRACQSEPRALRVAAMETLTALGVGEALAPTLVQGENMRRPTSSSSPATRCSASSPLSQVIGGMERSRPDRPGSPRSTIRRYARMPCCSKRQGQTGGSRVAEVPAGRAGNKAHPQLRLR